MRTRRSFAAISVVTSVTLGGVLGACKARPGESGSVAEAGAGSASAAPAMTARVTDSGLVMIPVVHEYSDAGPISSAIPVPISKIERTLNPSKLPPYAGPKGIVEGVVHVSGPAPAKRDFTIPFECGEAYATYGKVFREGNGRTLADAMVAVTGYEGYIPPTSDVYPISIHGCAYDRRTLVLSYGQRIEVTNRDPKNPFLPKLDGSTVPAQLVAMPRGDAVKLYPTEVGHYALRDEMKGSAWMYADVLVLQYTTHTVTGLDGKFRIAGIPAGKRKIAVFLPAIDADLHPDAAAVQSSVEQEIEIKDGETTTLDIDFPYKPKPKAPAAPKPSVTVPVIR